MGPSGTWTAVDSFEAAGMSSGFGPLGCLFGFGVSYASKMDDEAPLFGAMTVFAAGGVGAASYASKIDDEAPLLGATVVFGADGVGATSYASKIDDEAPLF